MTIGTPTIGTPVQETVAATSRSVPYPATVNANDMAFLLCANGSTSNTAINAPTGYTQINQVSNTGNTLAPAVAAFRHTCTGSEGGTNLTVTSGNIAGVFAIVIVPNVATGASSMDVTAIVDDKQTASTTIGFPTITPVTPNTTMLYIVAANSTTVTVNPISGFTELADRTVAGARGFEIAYLQNVAAGAVTYSTTTRWSGSTRDTGLLLALRPAVVSQSSGVSETAGATDAAARVITLARAAAETSGASDAVSANLTAGGASRSVSESAGASDAVTRTLTLGRAAAETAGASDAVTRTSSRSRATAETAGATDAVGRTETLPRAAAESAGATDTVTRTAAKSRAVSETAGASDAVTRTAAKSRAAAETAGASDAVGRTETLPRAAAETAGATDAVARTLLHAPITRSVSENAGAVDTVAVGARSFSRPVSESAPAVDTATRTMAEGRGVSDNAGASDTVNRTLGNSRSAPDSAGGTDTVTVSKGFVRTLLENIGGTDLVTRLVALVRGVTETATAVDSVHGHPPSRPAEDPRAVLAHNRAAAELMHNAHSAVLERR